MKALDYERLTTVLFCSDKHFWNGSGSTVFIGCNSDLLPVVKEKYYNSAHLQMCVLVKAWWFQRKTSGPSPPIQCFSESRGIPNVSPNPDTLQSCAHWLSCTLELEDSLCTNSRHELIIHLWRPSDKLAANRPRATTQWRQLSSTSR